MINVFRKQSFTWENLQQDFRSLSFYTTDYDLISSKKYKHFVEDHEIAEVTNENMNQGMYDENNTNQILTDLPKSYIPKGTTAAVWWELLNEKISLTYMISGFRFSVLILHRDNSTKVDGYKWIMHKSCSIR